MPPYGGEPDRSVLVLLSQLSDVQQRLGAAYASEIADWRASLLALQADVQASSRKDTEATFYAATELLPQLVLDEPIQILPAVNSDERLPRRPLYPPRFESPCVPEGPPLPLTVEEDSVRVNFASEPATPVAEHSSPPAASAVPSTSRNSAVPPSLTVSQAAEERLVSSSTMRKSASGLFELRGPWLLSESELQRIQKKAHTAHLLDARKKMPTLSRSRSQLFSDGFRQVRQSSHSFVVHPGSVKRIVWDVLACILLIYDCLMIPMQVFDLPRNSWIVVSEWLRVIYWTLDISASFITGIYVGSEPELRLKKIARNYVQSWFPFDVAVVLPEWLLLLVNNLADAAASLGLARSMRTARVLRVLRFLKFMHLLRLVKVRQLTEDLRDKLNNDVALMSLSVVKMIAIVCLLTHALACMWYGVGNSPEGWVYAQGINSVNTGEKYLFSFQWSMARLHPSNMGENMELQTFTEKVFSIFATVNAIVFSSIFVSHITNKMAEMKRMRAQRTSKLVLIRMYVQRHSISLKLAMQLKRHIVTSYAIKLRSMEEADLMAILPSNLVMDLRWETWSPVITKHALFDRIQMKDPRTECDICFQALVEVPFFQSETLFATGDACAQMLFMSFGELSYTRGKVPEGRVDVGLASEPSCTEDSRDVRPGQWVSEAALWVRWMNCGELRAENSGAAVALGAAELGAVVAEHEHVLLDVVAHARAFIQDLNRNPGSCSDLAAEPEMELRRSSSHTKATQLAFSEIRLP